MKRYAFLLALLLTIVTMSVAANVAKQHPSCQADTS